MPLVTLVMANGPGFPLGSAEHRYALTVTLTPGGMLDSGAWLADPDPWPLTRYWPGEAPSGGDVHWDEDTGWFLRVFPAGSELSDTPLHALIRNPGQLRPGEYVTMREPNGSEYGWRVVSVG